MGKIRKQKNEIVDGDDGCARARARAGDGHEEGSGG